MDQPDDFNARPAAKSGRVAAARARLNNKRVKAQALVNRRRLQTAETLTRLARRAAALKSAKCRACGKRMPRGSQFCAHCGASGSSPAPAKVKNASDVKKPNLLRRLLAQVIDRLLALPFLIWVYPKWWWVILAYHLLCEIFNGRSPGKMICRIRVVDAKSLAKCGSLRGVLRRIGAACGQVAYWRWETLPFALGYDLISFFFIWRDGKGQRIEDKLFGTRVIGEGNFRNYKRNCAVCGTLVSARVRFCPQCGKNPLRNRQD